MATPKKPLLEQLTGTVGAVAALLTAVAALLVAWSQWGPDDPPVKNDLEINKTDEEPGPAPPPPDPVFSPSPEYPYRAMLEHAQTPLVIVRAQPSSTSAEVGTISPGEVVLVGEAVNGWRPVRKQSGVIGWTRAGYLTVAPN